jgi:type IV secretory pathway TraG/TraD family ATPase VirD4
LSLVGTFEDALLTGRTLMDTASSFGKGSGVTNESYWTQRGARVVAALLWAAHQTRRSIGNVFGWAATQDVAGPLSCLHDSVGDRVARDVLLGLTVPDGRGGTRPSSQAAAVWSFAEQAVALYAYPKASELATAPDLDVDAFVRGSDTLHIVCPSILAAELGPVIAVLVQALADARYRAHARALQGVDACKGELTLVLDEVANTAPLPTLPALCSEGAGQGVSLVLGTQDRAQLEARFGPEEARTIVSNCRDRVITAELGDRAFLEDVEALCGTYREEEVVTGTGDAGNTRSTSLRERPTWRAWELAQLPPFTALYLQGWSPQLIELVTWDGRKRTAPERGPEA